MNCADLEILLCDYVDGTLDAEHRRAIEAHLDTCAGCAELARDAAAAVSFIERAAGVEPPAELVTRILFQIPNRRQTSESRGGPRRFWSRWFEAVLQPRFAMGMAMTILSFAMIGRFAGIQPRQLQVSDLNPAKVWAATDDQLQRTWARVVKYYESLRLVYEVQSRLKEWTQAEDEQRRTRAGEAGQTADPGANRQSGAEQGRQEK